MNNWEEEYDNLLNTIEPELFQIEKVKNSIREHIKEINKSWMEDMQKWRKRHREEFVEQERLRIKGLLNAKQEELEVRPSSEKAYAWQVLEDIVKKI